MNKLIYGKNNFFKLMIIFLISYFFLFNFVFSNSIKNIKNNLNEYDKKISSIQKAIKESEYNIKKFSGKNNF